MSTPTTQAQARVAFDAVVHAITETQKMWDEANANGDVDARVTAAGCRATLKGIAEDLVGHVNWSVGGDCERRLDRTLTLMGSR